MLNFTRPVSEEVGSTKQRPSNIKIEICEPVTHGVGMKRYTDYLVKTKTTLPIFTSKEFAVRRRYSDFEWLKTKMENKFKIKTPDLPNKAWTRQISFSKDSMFDEEFLKSRCELLEIFINNLSEHPLVQNDSAWAAFLTTDELEKS